VWEVCVDKLGRYGQAELNVKVSDWQGSLRM